MANKDKDQDCIEWTPDAQCEATEEKDDGCSLVSQYALLPVLVQKNGIAVGVFGKPGPNP